MIEDIKLNIEKLIWILIFYFLILEYITNALNMQNQKMIFFLEFLIGLFLADLDIFFEILKKIFFVGFVLVVIVSALILFNQQDIKLLMQQADSYFYLLIAAIAIFFVIKIIGYFLSKSQIFHSLIAMILITFLVHVANMILFSWNVSLLASLCFLIGYLSHFKFEKRED